MAPLTTTRMAEHEVVSPNEWIVRRRELLKKEKEFTRLRDELSRERRELPWEKVETEYVFDGPNGKEKLADLFNGRSQLIVYHFMFGPNWEAGCPSCSYLSDHFDGMLIHLVHRDVSLVAISRAPIDQIQAFQSRMGWKFHWVSSFANEFNQDYHVSFKKGANKDDQVTYNYQAMNFVMEELPGLSVFYKKPNGEIFHTYSTYARGLDILVDTYNFLDLVPKGRDEGGLTHTMAWVRHHDRYTSGYFVDPKAGYVQPKVLDKPKVGEHTCCGSEPK